MTIGTEERAAETWDDDGGHAASNAGPGIESIGYFAAKTFQIPELKGISTRNIQEHLELYKGYVKFSNHILNRMRELPMDEAHSYERCLLQRRFAYEHNGMMLHELFFEQFVGGPGACVKDGPFLDQVVKAFGSFEALVTCLKGIAMTRSVGWAMLYTCPDTSQLIAHWIDEHHVGLLSGARPILALDMWEHAYACDYSASQKRQYVDAFFQNLSWIKVEARFGK